ncbi:MAG: response regulator transcription factor [Myxococcaceae bacterium]
MSRLGAIDSRRVRDIAGSLRTLVDGGPGGLDTALPEIAGLVGFDKAVAYGFAPQTASLELDLWHQYNTQANARAVLDGWLRGKTVGWTTWNPFRPDPSQRNVAVTAAQIARRADLERLPVTREIFPKFGLSGCDQLRVLVCEGASLLAFVGGWRQDPFTPRERRLLQALVPAIQRRLSVERLLGRAPFALSALGAALEQIPAPAFVVRGADAGVLHANEAGRVLLDGDRRGLALELRAALRGRGPGEFSLTRLTGRGLGEHYLAVRRAAQPGLATKLRMAARRWGLTPRQVDVLAQLATGAANRTIAAELGCGESTIELHVTALLHRSGSESRAALVARFWSQP